MFQECEVPMFHQSQYRKTNKSSPMVKGDKRVGNKESLVLTTFMEKLLTTSSFFSNVQIPQNFWFFFLDFSKASCYIYFQKSAMTSLDFENSFNEYQQHKYSLCCWGKKWERRKLKCKIPRMWREKNSSMPYIFLIIWSTAPISHSIGTFQKLILHMPSSLFKSVNSVEVSFRGRMSNHNVVWLYGGSILWILCYLI